MKHDGTKLNELNWTVEQYFDTDGNSNPIEVVRQAAIDREKLMLDIQTRLGTGGNFADNARKFRVRQLEALGIDPTTLTLFVRV